MSNLCELDVLRRHKLKIVNITGRTRFNNNFTVKYVKLDRFPELVTYVRFRIAFKLLIRKRTEKSVQQFGGLNQRRPTDDRPICKKAFMRSWIQT